MDLIGNILIVLSFVSIIVGTSWFFFKLNARTERNERSLKSFIESFKNRNRLVDQHIHHLEKSQSDTDVEVNEIKHRLSSIEKDIHNMKDD